MSKRRKSNNSNSSSRGFTIGERFATDDRTELNHSSLSLTQDCQHSFTAIWTADTQLLNYCTSCLCSQPVADAHFLQERRRQVAAVLAEYQQALLKCRTKTSRREFEDAITTKHQQLAHIDLVLEELQHQTISVQSFNVEHPLELKLEQTGRASGWLEQYTKTKLLKSGITATYPLVQGERDSDNPHHWYWAYRWEEKIQGAKSDNGYVTRAVSCPRHQVQAVQGAISSDWSVQKVLKLLNGKADHPTT